MIEPTKKFYKGEYVVYSDYYKRTYPLDNTKNEVLRIYEIAGGDMCYYVQTPEGVQLGARYEKELDFYRPEFKADDMVRCINSDFTDLEVGKLYNVSMSFEMLGVKIVKLRETHNATYNASRFVLVSRPVASEDIPATTLPERAPRPSKPSFSAAKEYREKYEVGIETARRALTKRYILALIEWCETLEEIKEALKEYVELEL